MRMSQSNASSIVFYPGNRKKPLFIAKKQAAVLGEGQQPVKKLVKIPS